MYSICLRFPVQPCLSSGRLTFKSQVLQLHFGFSTTGSPRGTRGKEWMEVQVLCSRSLTGESSWASHILNRKSVLSGNRLQAFFSVSNSLFSPYPFRPLPVSQSVQSLSRVRLFLTPWTSARQASLSITNSWSLLKLMSIKSVMPSKHLILCCPLLLLPSIFPSITVFSNESVLCIRWPKYWSCSFSISPSNVYSGLISFRMDWLDLLAVQGTLRSLLQHHSSKASVLLCSAFFVVQCSHPYMTTGKTIALSRQTFAGKVMSLLFNMLSSLVLTFLPRRKCLLNLWLQSPSAAILVHPPQKKSLSPDLGYPRSITILPRPMSLVPCQ